MHEIELTGDVLAAQERLAGEVRAELARFGVRAFNVMGAIGSGKTLLIERVIERLRERIRIGAIAGDVAGSDDYERFRKLGIPAVNLNTETECHLDAHLVQHALEELPLGEIDVLFIENVGNLVCPADFPLGVERNIVVISVTEGDDMVRKHPKIFAQTDLVVLNKLDLAELVEVEPERIVADYNRLNPNGTIILTDAKHGRGIGEFIAALGLDSR
ncbi:MAG: hydrogenase nickel incorporation protein HypB [Candidatus Acetothermia bacterium]|nr:hydrogenase nickel incorporation protein HypB [Candidatus Acetothermia bacterium]